MKKNLVQNYDTYGKTKVIKKQGSNSLIVTLMILSLCLLLGACGAISGNEKNSNNESNSNKNINKGEKNNSEKPTDEMKDALVQAKAHIELSPLSKHALYNVLVSDAGDKFSPEAAQYALDNINIDYKDNALKTAKTYLKFAPLSDKELYVQLTSKNGGSFTHEEAQYAIDNLKK